MLLAQFMFLANIRPPAEPNACPPRRSMSASQPLRRRPGPGLRVREVRTALARRCRRVASRRLRRHAPCQWRAQRRRRAPPAAGAVAARAPAAAAPRHQDFDNSSNAALFSRLTDDLRTIHSSPIFAGITHAAPHEIDKHQGSLSGFQHTFSPAKYDEAMSSVKKYKAGANFFPHKTCFSAHHQAYHYAKPAWTGCSLFTLQGRRPTRWT